MWTGDKGADLLYVFCKDHEKEEQNATNDIVIRTWFSPSPNRVEDYGEIVKTYYYGQDGEWHFRLSTK